jgi:hypothetical protein
MVVSLLLVATATAAEEVRQEIDTGTRPQSIITELDLNQLLPPKPAAVDVARTDPRVVEAYVKALRKWYSLYEARIRVHDESVAHNKKTLAWHRTASQLVFWLVVAIVLSGVALCWIQMLGSRFGARAPGNDQETTDVELSMGRLRVSSPILGVIVLTISLAFFYLYLTQVYSVTVVDMTGTTSMPNLAPSADSGRTAGAPADRQAPPKAR